MIMKLFIKFLFSFTSESAIRNSIKQYFMFLNKITKINFEFLDLVSDNNIINVLEQIINSFKGE